MQPTFAPTQLRSLDFLAEVVNRTRASAPRRNSTALRLGIVAAVGDALVVALALFLAFSLRFRSGMPNQTADGSIFFTDYAGYMFLAGTSALIVLTCLGLYNREMLLHFRKTINRVGKGWGIWTCGLLMMGSIFDFEPSISRMFLGFASAFVGVGLLTWRAGFHRFCQQERFAAPLRKRVLFLGWNEDAERLSQIMSLQHESPCKLVGYVHAPVQTLSSRPSAVCLGDSTDLAEILKYSLIDTVILCDREMNREMILHAANVCEREIVEFQLIPSYFEILLVGLHLENFSGVPLLGVSKLPLNAMGARLLKRACDIVGALLGLLITGPMIAIFGLLVYLESPGTIFYHQRRSGRNGATFNIIKIRSMRLDAEKEGVVGWSTKEDDRRLKIGSLMRRLNIDELPQFWNVLKGEMSLVGPRPERPELIAGFKYEIPHYNARHTVKPGITGWAQVNGFRGDTDLAERIRHDLYYMENWSLWLDLQCLVYTLIARKNAY